MTGEVMERIRHSDITSFEVWDLLVNGTLLGEFTCSPEFPAVLCQAIEMLRAGQGATNSGEPLPPVATGFDALFVTGGRFAEPELQDALSALPFPVLRGEGGLYAGATGGFEILRGRGLSGWVVDLGGSHLKIAAPQRRFVFARDWSRLFLPTDVSSAEWPAQRRRLREFIALRLQMAMAEIGAKPAAIVFGLPTRLANDGTPGSSSYAGMRNDVTLVPDALELAGLSGMPLFVLNDAELATLSARLDPRLAGFRKVLVLTLGFGIGAALIHRDL